MSGRRPSSLEFKIEDGCFIQGVLIGEGDSQGWTVSCAAGAVVGQEFSMGMVESHSLPFDLGVILVTVQGGFHDTVAIDSLLHAHVFPFCIHQAIMEVIIGFLEVSVKVMTGLLDRDRDTGCGSAA